MDGVNRGDVGLDGRASPPQAGGLYANDDFDALVADARTELGDEAQADLYRQADDIASRQDYAMLPLVYPHYNYVAKPYVKGHKVGNMSFHMGEIDVEA